MAEHSEPESVAEDDEMEEPSSAGTLGAGAKPVRPGLDATQPLEVPESVPENDAARLVSAV